MTKTKEILTDEKFQDIYTDKKFRNQVAYAHGHTYRDGTSGYITCSFPVQWFVTQEQINLAQAEIDRSATETKERHMNNLLFIGMGMVYKTDTDIGNYRIRTEFLNDDGKRIFVEFGTALDNAYTRMDFSILRGKEDQYGYLRPIGGDDLDRMRYTPEAILQFVNSRYGCSFAEIHIDNYDLPCEGIMCVSPGYKNPLTGKAVA